MGRPRLLFLGHTLPFPPDEGVNTRSFNILRLLARTFEVTVLCFYRQGSRPRHDLPSRLQALREFAQVEAFAIPQEHSRARLVYDHARSVILRRAYTRYCYESRPFQQRLREILKSQRFDLVHVDSLDLARYLPQLTDLPLACTHHNVESELLNRRAAFEPSAWKRHYLRSQARLTRNEERSWSERVQLNLAVSPEDRATLERVSPRARVAIVPNGVDTDFFQPGSANGQDVVFVGSHGWFPNRDAMSLFAADILPILRASSPDVRVTWVGRVPAGVRRSYEHAHQIRLTGHVDDTRPFLEAAACCIVPLRVGGGTRLKVLEAWAMGKAVVSTSIGCEGLEAIDGENILVRDSAASFADAVRAVLQDEQLRSSLGRTGRRTAQRLYDWDTIYASLQREYLALLPNAVEKSQP
jgi:glycosyltransferase involved in cell wall biosynthesis